MPTVRYLAPRTGNSELSALFYGEMKRQDVKCYELEDKLHAAPNTVRKWLQHPERAPLEKLIQICKILGVSKQTFCETMKWVR